MSTLQGPRAWLAEARNSAEYAAEHARMDFAVALERRMGQLGVMPAELARRLGTRPVAVTQVLRGDARLTIDRLAEMAHALDARVRVEVSPRTRYMRWHERVDATVPLEQIENARIWARQQHGGSQAGATKGALPARPVGGASVEGK